MKLFQKREFILHPKSGTLFVNRTVYRTIMNSEVGSLIEIIFFYIRALNMRMRHGKTLNNTARFTSCD